MKGTLIVNADDFGLCKEITIGIIHAYRQGIVTATSVAVNGRYFKESIPLLKDSGIDAGIHLMITGGEKPVSGNIPGLIDSNGFFLKSYREVIPRIMLGRFDQNALEKELSQQISLLLDNNISVSHIDSHQHLHLLPGIRNMVMDLARQFHIRWIRVPQARMTGVKGLGMNMLANNFKKGLKKQNLAFTDTFLGFEQGGHMDEATLSALLKTLHSGVTELMVHPGYDASAYYNWGYAWQDELNALTSDTIKELIKSIGITLTNFKGIM
jgi:predicted glycoside hydrolase/deacetylase ChbG (UPF0249 family)